MSTQENTLPYTLHFISLANAAKRADATPPELTAFLRGLTPVERRELADDIAKQEG